MDKQLDELLNKTFPNLYADRNASMQETCMCWGFCTGNGWFLIIWNLSKELEKLILDLPEKDRYHCKASQVKEKFGTLRFYMSTSTEQMERLISEAEIHSASTCETCGRPGKIYSSHGWVTTSCERHAPPTQELDKEEEADG